MPDYKTPCEYFAGLYVFVIGAVIANFRIGERDYLTGIAWVCENLLVTAQAGIEHQLPGCCASPAEG